MQYTAQALLETLQIAMPYLQRLGADEVSFRPAPGKWSKKEILGHLLDSACNNQQKFVRALIAPDGHVDFVGYRQDEWVAIQGYQNASWDALLQLWYHYNVQLAHFIAQIPEAGRSNTVSIDGVGPFRIDFIAPDYVEHLRHHLKAIIPDAGIESKFSNVYGA